MAPRKSPQRHRDTEEKNNQIVLCESSLCLSCLRGEYLFLATRTGSGLAVDRQHVFCTKLVRNCTNLTLDCLIFIDSIPHCVRIYQLRIVRRILNCYCRMCAGAATIGHRTPAFEDRGRTRGGLGRNHGLAPPKRGFAKASRMSHSATEYRIGGRPPRTRAGTGNDE